MAAVALGVLLVGVVVVGRLGMEEPGPPSALVSPPAASPDAPAAERSPLPSPLPSPQQPAAPSFPAGSVADVPAGWPRYLDGIPTAIAGERVFRLGSAFADGGGGPLLVGGWYLGPDCLRVGRCVGRLVDEPAVALRSARSVALTGLIAPGSGPMIIRATISERCDPRTDRPTCLPTLSVLEVVWQGDFFTRTAPAGVQPMLSALQYAFPDMRPEPLLDFARCAIEWPPQTYRSSAGGPRMTLVFPTVEDRVATQDEIRANWPVPATPEAGQCVDHFMVSDEPAGWVGVANVMVWLPETELARKLLEAAAIDALVMDRQPEADVPQPLTTWAAMRGLRRWDARLAVLPSHDFEVWGADLPAEAYALDDPLVRLLLVFPARAERRAYQRDVDPQSVIVLHNVRATQESVGRGMLELRETEARWLGFRNVLLQVSGPVDFDDRLRDALSAELR